MKSIRIQAYSLLRGDFMLCFLPEQNEGFSKSKFNGKMYAMGRLLIEHEN